MAPRARTLLALLPLLPLACGDSGRATGSDGATSSAITQGSLNTLSNGDSGDSSAGQGTTSGVTEGVGGTTGGVTGDRTSGDPTNNSNGDSGPKFDIGGVPDAGKSCGDSGGDGMADTSYIWIPSTSDGWVSKIKTPPAANCGVYGRIQAVG